MAFTVSNGGIIIPEDYAQPLGEIAANVPGRDRGFEDVAKALNTLFLFKQGAMVLDWTVGGYPLRLTTDRRLHLRCKTPMYAGWTQSTYPRMRVYTVANRSTAKGVSSWTVAIQNNTKGTTSSFQVAAGLATGGIVVTDETPIDIDDTADYNEFEIYVSSSSGTVVGDAILGFALIPERAHKTVLSTKLGGYNRNVNPLDSALWVDNNGAYVDVLQDAHAMALDIWQRRVGQILSNPQDWTHPGGGGYRMSHRFMAHCPAGVDEASLHFRTPAGSGATINARAISGDGTVEETSAGAIGNDSWGALTLPIPVPSWGGDVEIQIESNADYVSACGWWNDASYTRSKGFSS